MIFLVLLLIGAVLIFVDMQYKLSDEGALIVIGLLLIIVCVALLIVLNVCGVYRQLNGFESLTMLERQEQICSTKAQALTDEFAHYLAEMYPEHEARIYDRISPDNLNVYLVQYPELRTHETLLSLVSNINQLQSDVYDKQLERETIKRDLRFRPKSPVLIGWLIPKYREQ